MNQHTTELYKLIKRIHKKESLLKYEKNIISEYTQFIKDFIKIEKLNDPDLFILKEKYEASFIEGFSVYFSLLKETFTLTKEIFSKNIAVNHLYPLNPKLFKGSRLDLTTTENLELLVKKLKVIATSKKTKEGISTNIKSDKYFLILLLETQRDTKELIFPKPFFKKEELKFPLYKYLINEELERVIKLVKKPIYYLSNQDIQHEITVHYNEESNVFRSRILIYKTLYVLHSLAIFSVVVYFIESLLLYRQSVAPFVEFNAFDFVFSSRIVDFFLYILFVPLSMGLWLMSAHRDDETKTNDWMIASLMSALLGIFFIHPLLIFELSLRFFGLWIAVIASAIITRGLGRFHQEKRRFLFLAVSWFVFVWTYLEFDWILYLVFLGTYLSIMLGLLFYDNKKKGA
jgi:hypothetical protein